VAEVSSVAVVGAGGLGRGIAHLTALSGYLTILEDLLPSSLRKADQEFRTSLEQAVISGRVSAMDARGALSRLEYAGSVEEAARRADVIIEAVPEELESKSEIFILLDKICRPATMLVTSSSTLSVTQLANVTYRAERCVGMRFSTPVLEMKQLEIVRGQKSSDDTVATALAIARRMKLEVGVVEESLTAAEPSA
jgi:3-hydroxybutyryl-CoA dehydrogenase